MSFVDVQLADIAAKPIANHHPTKVWYPIKVMNPIMQLTIFIMLYKFNVKYILSLHKEALKHLYAFAGKLRSVNLSKGGFPFAAAKFLPDSMSVFENEILSKLKNTYNTREELVRDIAIVHGELLFIHPFREGNGRTARLLANLMSRKAGYGSLRFEKVGKKEFERYVMAVQNCANKDYKKMIEFIDSIFPD